jgi:molybdopterin-guanine dinucleotide biosynthesis protein A
MYKLIFDYITVKIRVSMFFELIKTREDFMTTAIILTGGKSRRMGSNKSFLKYGDKTFLEHQIARLSKIFDEIILSANDRDTYASFNLPVIPDVMPEKGPLSGICAGLMRAKDLHSFVVACDMPFIHEDIILYLKRRIDTYDVVIPQTNRGLEPMHAFYSKNCIQPMHRCLVEGRLRIVDFLSEVKVRVVSEEEITGLNISLQSLINLNTPEEYKKYCEAVPGI